MTHPVNEKNAYPPGVSLDFSLHVFLIPFAVKILILPLFVVQKRVFKQTLRTIEDSNY